MEDSIRTGKSIQEKVVPGGYWKYLGEHPEDILCFDEAMMGKALGHAPDTPRGFEGLRLFRFSHYRRRRRRTGLSALRRVGSCSENSRSALRLPHVTASAQAAGMESERLRMHPRNFFTDALPAGDCYLIMQVMHD